MKRLLVLTAAMASGAMVMAQDVGRVISSTPVMQQVEVPRQVCSVQQVQVQPRKSGAGLAIGAIAGGALGNAVGNGGGRAAATLIGLVGGAVLGNSIEGGQRGYVENVQRCETQTFYESQPVAYNVVYEYAGRQYAVQTPNDPGRTIAVQVSPVITGNAPVYAPVQAIPAPQYGGGYERQSRYEAPRGGYSGRDNDRYYDPLAEQQRALWINELNRQMR